MRTLNNHTILLSLIGLTAIDQDFTKKLTQIVIATAQERPLDTIIYTSYENDTARRSANGLEASDIIRALSKGQDKPLLHIGTSAPIERYVVKFNAEMLTIAKLNQRMEQDKLLLYTLWQRLWHNTQTRLILLFEDSANEAYIEQIMHMCAEHTATKVIAFQPRMTIIERSYWILRIFPTTQVLKRTLPTRGAKLFINHLDNMYGHPLRIIEKALWPQMYSYIPSNGAPSTMSGFLGRSLVEYAKHLNATILHPHSMRNKLYLHDELSGFLGNSTLDIGSLTPYKVSDRYIGFSIIFKCTDYCFMVPLEQPLPKAAFYLGYVNKTVAILFCLSVVSISCTWTFTSRCHCQRPVYIIDYFVNESVLQGLFSLPFWWPKQITRLHKALFILIVFAGLNLTTTYISYLQSFLVNPPIAGRAETIDDLVNRGIQIAVDKQNLFAMLAQPDYQEHDENFIVFKNITQFLKLQDNLDTRYAFAITDMWGIYEEQQKYFSRPLFRLSDICLVKNYPMTLPLQENSIYRENLNDFLMRLRAAGLIRHWQKQSFLEFLDMDWISLEDRNKQQCFQPLKVEDLQLILLSTCIFLFLSFCCFILEIYWQKVGSILSLSM